jgi:hypothetical protein
VTAVAAMRMSAPKSNSRNMANLLSASVVAHDGGCRASHECRNRVARVLH